MIFDAILNEFIDISNVDELFGMITKLFLLF